MLSLVIMATGSDMAAMVSAVFMASSISEAAGTTRATRLERSASAASIMRPVRHISMSCAGVLHARVKDHLHGFGLADLPDQPLRAARARHHAQLDLGLAEPGGVG